MREVLLRVSQLACDLPAIAELDINPLLVDEHGALAVDGRIRLHAPGEAAAPLAIVPYPQQLEETLVVDGQALRVRPIQPEDGERLREFYAQASPEDMRLRFFMSRREVPRSELARFSQIDYDREMAFIAVAPAEPGAPPSAARMAGEVRGLCDPDNLQAEFAIQVAAPWQGKGLGRQLLDKLVRYLHARGTARLVGQCRSENTGMAALARSAGLTVRPGEAGDHVLEFSLELQR